MPEPAAKSSTSRPRATSMGKPSPNGARRIDEAARLGDGDDGVGQRRAALEEQLAAAVAARRVAEREVARAMARARAA